MDLPNMHDNGRVLDDLDNWRKIFWDETLVEDRLGQRHLLKDFKDFWARRGRYARRESWCD